MMQAPGRSNDRGEKLEQGLNTLQAIIKYGAAFAGALEIHEEFDPQKLVGLLIPDQFTLDKAMATGNITRLSPGVFANQTDWNGLTPEQERQREDERLSQKRQEEALAEAEYEETMERVRDEADRLMAQLDEQRRECLQKLAKADARAIVLSDGRRVLVGDKPGEFIDEATGHALQGADKAEAQSLQKPDSETAAERKKLTDRLIQIRDAEEHVQKAKDLASQDGKNLSPEEKKQKEIEAQKELAIAAAKTKGVPDLDTGGPDADIGAALGLDTPQTGRTASFAATLDEKDTRATGLQDQFTGAAQQPDVLPAPAPATAPAGDSAPAGTTTRPQISQPNQ